MQTALTITNGIGRLTLINPPRNELDKPEFICPDDLRAFLSDKKLLALVITGAGKNFCAGAASPDTISTLGSSALDAGKKIIELIADAELPTLAVIRGACMGAGLEIALSCTFRIASSGAMFGFPECARGLMPGFGGTFLTPAKIGAATAVKLALGADMIGADEALSIGLVDRVVSTSELAATAENFLLSITKDRTPKQIRFVMRAINAGLRKPRAEALALESQLFAELASDIVTSGRST